MERDTRGRFDFGNPGGPGRPRRSSEERYLEVVKEVVDEGKLKEVVQAVTEEALKGDIKAASLIFKHLIPVPEMKQRLTHDDARRIDGMAPEEITEQAIQGLLAGIAEVKRKRALLDQMPKRSDGGRPPEAA